MKRVLPHQKTLWVGGIDVWMTKDFLTQIFAKLGPLVSLSMNKEGMSGALTCFVQYETHDAAKTVIESFTGNPIPGTNKVFKLDWASFAETQFDSYVPESMARLEEERNKLIV